VGLYEVLKPLQSVGSGSDELSPSAHGSEEFMSHIQDEAGKIGIPTTAIRLVYPATSMQRMMLQQNELDSGVYFTQTVLGFNGKLDHQRMSSLWQKVFWAHPAMHTTFARIAFPDVSSFFALELEPSILFRPLRVLPGSVSTRMLELILKQDINRGFAFGGPMFRLMMLQESCHSCKLVLSYHHASCDGWSLNILLSDLAGVY
jgi:nonribosomal peptide synthetase DhbF